jgi:hypothetical protein
MSNLRQSSNFNWATNFSFESTSGQQQTSTHNKFQALKDFSILRYDNAENTSEIGVYSMYDLRASAFQHLSGFKHEIHFAVPQHHSSLEASILWVSCTGSIGWLEIATSSTSHLETLPL